MKRLLHALTILIILSTQLSCTASTTPTSNKVEMFSGERAYEHVIAQADFGPRIPESQAHGQTIEYIVEQLEASNWSVQRQDEKMFGHRLINIEAAYGKGERIVLIGAHYDSRIFADHDPDPGNRSLPVPGANDGASGVSVLLELARILPAYLENEEYASTALADKIYLVFFDGEDNGNIQGWDWILGSTAYVERHLDFPLVAAIIVDMIGDSDLNIYMESNSNKAFSGQIWQVAATLGYGDVFINQTKYRILDDHLPFVQKGIPSVDIIDFDYPYWHTVQDTVDKVSPESLEIVGNVLLHWLFPGLQ